MKEEISMSLCKIVDFFSCSSKSMRRTSGMFYVHNISNLLKNEIPTIVTRFYWPIETHKRTFLAANQHHKPFHIVITSCAFTIFFSGLGNIALYSTKTQKIRAPQGGVYALVVDISSFEIMQYKSMGRMQKIDATSPHLLT